MKVKLGNVSPGATPLVRGSVLILDTKHGAVAMKWPRPRGKPKTPYDFYKQKEFAWAGSYAANPLDLDYITATYAVKETTLVPRDWLMMCAYGRAYELQFPDGTSFTNYRDMAPNPQYILDLITTDIGSLLYRSPVGWVPIPIGSNGQVLSLIDQVPQWIANPTPGGNGPLITTLPLVAANPATNAGSWTATFTTPLIDELGVWNPAFPQRLYIPPTATKIRVSGNWTMRNSATTNVWQLATLDPTGGILWQGRINFLASMSGAQQVRNWSITGPWVPNPGFAYLRMWAGLNNTVINGFTDPTCFTLEAYIP